MSFLIAMGYAAAIFAAIMCAAFLVSVLPQSGFAISDEEGKDVPGWVKARNVVMIPVSAYVFYLFSKREAAQGVGPWSEVGGDFGEFAGFASLLVPFVEAVNSVGRFFASLWSQLTGGVSTVASYIDVVVPIPGLAMVISVILALVLVGGVLALLGQSLLVALSVGGTVLVTAPIAAHAIAVAFFAGALILSIVVSLVVFAFLLTGGRLFDNLQ